MTCLTQEPSKEIPIESIRDGVIHTTDGRYVKIV